MFPITAYLLCFIVLFSRSLSWLHYEENLCEMSFMFPQYSKISLSKNITKKFPQYFLYKYTERFSLIEEWRLKILLVFFFPGSTGSFKQVRSLASSISNEFSATNGNVAFFTFDFHSDLSFFDGACLLQQSQFALLSIKSILRRYKKKTFDVSVILVGHSIGGSIVNHVSQQIAAFTQKPLLLIHLASPVKGPIMSFDEATHLFYHKRNLKCSLCHRLSFCGGNREFIVPCSTSEQAPNDENGSFFTATTSSLPFVWVSGDHYSILWCKQFLNVLSQFTLSYFHSDKSQQQFSSLNRQYFLVKQRTSEINNEFLRPFYNESKESFLNFIAEHAYSVNERSNHNNIFLTLKNGDFLYLHECVHRETIFLVKSDIDLEMNASLLLENTLKINALITHQHLPPFLHFSFLQLFTVNGEEFAKSNQNSFPILMMGGRSKSKDTHRDVVASSESIIKAYAPAFFLQDKIRMNSNHSWRIRIEGMERIWQSYSVHLRVEQSKQNNKKVPHYLYLHFHVPWFQQDVYSVVTSSKNLHKFVLYLESNKPATAPVEDVPELSIYKIQDEVSFDFEARIDFNFWHSLFKILAHYFLISFLFLYQLTFIACFQYFKFFYLPFSSFNAFPLQLFLSNAFLLFALSCKTSFPSYVHNVDSSKTEDFEFHPLKDFSILLLVNTLVFFFAHLLSILSAKLMMTPRFSFPSPLYQLKNINPRFVSFIIFVSIVSAYPALPNMYRFVLLLSCALIHSTTFTIAHEKNPSSGDKSALSIDAFVASLSPLLFIVFTTSTVLTLSSKRHQSMTPVINIFSRRFYALPLFTLLKSMILLGLKPNSSLRMAKFSAVYTLFLLFMFVSMTQSTQLYLHFLMIDVISLEMIITLFFNNTFCVLSP